MNSNNNSSPSAGEISVKQEKLYSRKPVWTLAAVMVLFTLGGCLAIYNSLICAYDPSPFVSKQLIYMAAGLLLYWICAGIDFSFYRKISLWFLIVQCLLLAGVLVFGRKINGMRGWYDLGIFHIQPSELTKCSFLLYLCVYCGKHTVMGIRQWIHVFFWTALTASLVILEPDFGSTVVFFCMFLLCAVLKGINLYGMLIALCTMLLSGTLFLISNDYALKRILSYLNPEGPFSENAWHIRQFQYTMAHGSWTGAEWGQTLWSGAFLPLPHTDSIFASIVESTGFLGGMFLTLLFPVLACFFCMQSWKIKSENDDRKLFVFCAGAITALQGLLHISVNAVLLPPTGITLPFFSYGGSSLLAQMMLFGIAVSAMRKREDPLL